MTIHFVPPAAAPRVVVTKLQSASEEHGPVDIIFVTTNAGWPLTESVTKELLAEVSADPGRNLRGEARDAVAAAGVEGFDDVIEAPGLAVVENRGFASLVNRVAHGVYVAPLFIGIAAVGGLVALLRGRTAFCARRGLCVRCLYDLSGSPGACPECGWRGA